MVFFQECSKAPSDFFFACVLKQQKERFGETILIFHGMIFSFNVGFQETSFNDTLEN